MSTEQTIALAIALFAVMGLVFWRAAREPKPKGPKPAVELFDEGDLALENKPWSPTRGFYWFSGAELPEVYLAAPNVSSQHEIKIFAEDEAGARAELTKFLMRKLLDGGGFRGEVPPITAAPTRFRPLTKRKAARNAG